jgi:nitronate monooxygenase
MRPLDRDVPAYPVQNALTGDIRAEAGKRNLPDYMSLWAGQGVAMSRTRTAAELMRALESGLATALGHRWRTSRGRTQCRCYRLCS